MEEQAIARKESCWLKFKEIMFLFWDGFAFFGTDDNKLNRLEGKPPRWYDPFCNWRWMLANTIGCTVAIVILMKESSEFGHVRSQELGRAVEIKYDFDAQE